MRIKHLLATFILLIFAGQLSAAEQRPNVVLFFADDMYQEMLNYRDKQVSDEVRYLTPHLDRLASEGVVMAGAHITTPICTPSRFNLLAGKYASRCQSVKFKRTIKKIGFPIISWNSVIHRDHPHLGRYLDDAGYFTGFVGKNHIIKGEERSPRLDKDADLNNPKVLAGARNVYQQQKDYILTAGFDYAASLYSHNPDALGPEEISVHNMDWQTHGALQFLDRAAEQDEPFFLYFATTMVHSPNHHHRSWNADRRATPIGMLDKAHNVLPPAESVPARLKASGLTIEEPKNAGNVLVLDDSLGALMERLEENGQADNTIIIFYNDNGQNGKGCIYQSGAMGPAIVWKRGGFGELKRSDAFINTIDVAPTILDLCGVKYSEGAFDGVSFQPVLSREKKSVQDALFFEIGVTRAVRKGNWKYLAFRMPSDPEQVRRGPLRESALPMLPKDLPPPAFGHVMGHGIEGGECESQSAYYYPDQLYNLADDPGEQNNLADDPKYNAKLSEMKKLLRTHLASLPGKFPLDSPR